MGLTPGTRVGPYAIVNPLGAGGMGEVYRARDTTLNRDVAIKVLPDAFADDPDRLMRFTREAQVLASLNHPNIAAIYGIESRALVMELVEGEDLSAHIARGAIALTDALPIAKQIADALEAAHEAGVTHRDLKPANIKVRADGTVKVLDFGLAKAMDAAGAAEAMPDLQPNAPTLTSPAMTAMGMILGTAAYMSPEQARGRPVDRRADIWAYGCVLYEMLTGRRAFAGGDVSDLLVSVLRDTPDFAALPPGAPASVRRLLRRCLEKDPRKRLSAIGDARLELDELDAPAQTHGPPSRPGAVFAVAAALALAIIAATAAWYAKPAATRPIRLLELPAFIAASERLALSPDGTRVAYVLGGHLYVRALDAVTSQDLGPISSTNTIAFFPGALFWSPDSRTIGFSAEREVRTVPAAGGPVFAVATIPATGEVIAARWFRDGTIVFAVWRENVYSVQAAGGTPAVALALNSATEIDVHQISEAPDGRLIVTIHQRSGDRGITVLAGRGTGATQPRVLLSDDSTISNVRYVAPGFVFFDRQKTNAGLWVAPFTAGPLDVSRATLIQAAAGSADIADDGSLIFVLAARSRTAPVWIDRSGAASALIGAPFPDSGAGFALSPDGRRLAMVLGGEEAAALGEDDTSLVVRDLTTGADTRLTARTSGRSGTAASLIQSPSWFPSGDRILLSAGEVEAGGLLVQNSDEVTAPRRFAPGLTLGRMTRDGRTLGAVQDDRGRFHLMQAPVSADGVVGAAERVVQDDDPFVDEFDLSPDGRLVVYSAQQASGQRSVFLSDFPIGHGQRQVADDAGRPRFSSDGREIFYVKNGTSASGQSTRTLTSRTVTGKPSVTLGVAAGLFSGESAALMGQRGFDVAPDGRRFLTLKDAPLAPGEGKRWVWMQNWPAAVKK